MGVTSSGLLSSRSVNGGVCDIDDRDRHAGCEEAELLQSFERFELAYRRCDVAIQRLGPIRIDADVQPHRRHLPV